MGLVKLLLILDAKCEDANTLWWFEAVQPALDVFVQVAGSSYLAAEVVDQKIACFTFLFNDLLTFTSTL